MDAGGSAPWPELGRTADGASAARAGSAASCATNARSGAGAGAGATDRRRASGVTRSLKDNAPVVTLQKEVSDEFGVHRPGRPTSAALFVKRLDCQADLAPRATIEVGIPAVSRQVIQRPRTRAKATEQSATSIFTGTLVRATSRYWKSSCQYGR